MPINGTDFLADPIGTITSPYADILGSGWWLIPFTFIGIAIYLKTKSTVAVSAYLIAVGVFMSGGNIFQGYPEMSILYAVIAALGIVGVIVSIMLREK